MHTRRLTWLNLITVLTLLFQMAAPPLLQAGQARAAAPQAGTPSLQVTNRDAHLVDQDGDGLVEAGDTLRYTVEISNTGTADATGVVFNDTLSTDLSLIAGSIEATPLAYPQELTTQEDTPLGIILAGVDPDGDPQIFSVLTDPSQGLLSGTPPNLTYSPAADYNGPDSFTFKLCDTASPAGCDSATVSLSVAPVNDTPVVAASTFYVAEGAPNGTGFGTVAFSDPDAGQTHSFAITSGDPSHIFAIDSSTGEISLADTTQVDYETVKSYSLTVAVTDSFVPAAAGSAAITILVTDANDHPVLDPAAFNLSENSASGASVGVLTYSDPDIAQTYSFAITAGNTGGAFTIDPFGEIRVAAAAAVDYETNPSFSLTVQITDNGLPPLSDTAAVTVSLIDTNDAPLVPAQSFTLPENSPTATNVGTPVTVTDQDAVDSHTFAITGGNAVGAFGINAATGQVGVVNPAPLDYEITPSFVLTVTATDNGSPNLSGVGVVTINLGDANDAPLVTGASFDLLENSPNGSSVGTPLVFTDQDAADTHSFAILTGSPSSPFSIDAGGQIQVANSAALDFETVTSFTLTVQVTDNGSPARSGTAAVVVNLLDGNENPLVDTATFSLDENSFNGTSVGTVTFTDLDAGQNHTFAITLGNTGSAFQIDASSGAITVRTSAALNYEVTPTFNLTVQVTDDGTPNLSGTAIATIHLNNLNEAPAVNPATFGVPENSANGTSVGTVTVSEPDAGQSHSFSITGGDPAGTFTINATTGEITVAKSAGLDFETTPSYLLTVQAIDNGSPALPGSAAIVVNVANGNDTPQVSGGPFSVPENAASGTVVGAVSVTDQDAGQSHTYAITAGNAANAFAIHANTGQITVNAGAALNYEAQASYSLTVEATDDGVPAQTGSATVVVNLTDQNEQPVVDPLSPVSLPENSLNSANVGAPVTFSDPDSGQTHGFTIESGNTNGAFSISSSGQIQVANRAALNFEVNPSFTLTVRVTDNGSGNLYGETTVTINLTNVNDVPVVSGGPFSLNENSPADTVVGSVTVADDEISQTHTFAITAGNSGSAFKIDANGQISVNDPAAVDYETNPVFSLTVEATDDGAPPQTGSAMVVINLSDMNDAPRLSGGPFSIDENKPVGTQVGTVAVVDEPGQTHTFAITGGNTGDAFSINSTGRILVADSGMLNFEATPVFTLTVEVTDNGTPAESSTGKFRINVNNVNEAPVLSGGPFAVDENRPNAYVIGSMTATDQDSGQTRTFAIETSSAPGVVAISSTSGVISVTNSTALNYEAPLTSITLLIKVTDNGTPALSDTRTVVITVNNVDEAPVPTGETYQTIGNTLLQVAAVETATGPHLFVSGNLLANDSDPEGETLTASLVSASPGASVTINSTGTFTYVPPAGKTGSDSFTYSVSDAGPTVLSANATVTINLTSMVWYVRNNAAAGGTGVSSAPFDTLIEAEIASAAGSSIFVYYGDGTSTGQASGIILKANQRLIGEGVVLSIPASINGGPNPTILNTAGTQALIGNSAGNGVSVLNASGVEIRGLSISGSDSAIDVTTTGANNGGVTIQDNTINAAGAEGIDINGGSTGTLTVALNNNLITASGAGIDINRTAGTLYITAFNGNTINGNTGGTGISVNHAIFDATPGGGLDQISLGALSVGVSGNPVGGAGVAFSNVTGSLLASSVNIYASGSGLALSGLTAYTGSAGLRFDGGSTGNNIVSAGPALDSSLVTLNLDLSALAVSGGASGLQLLNTEILNTLTIDSGSSIANTTGSAFRVDNGAGNITYNGSISNNAGRSVHITNRDLAGEAGTIIFTNKITDNGQGILLDNNDAATINFSGGLALTTGSSTAFSAINGGTVNVTDPASDVNRITTTTGTGLNVVGTNIGSSGLTFEAIQANGAANGIKLDGTGSAGGLTVTGDGSTTRNTSGGTIQNTTGAGVLLNNTASVSLAHMSILNTQSHGVQGSTVAGFTLAYSTVDGAGDASSEDGLFFSNLSGNAQINDCVISNSSERNVYITNTSGTLSALTVTNSTLSNAIKGIYVSASGSNIGAQNNPLLITGSTFTNHAVGIDVVGASTTSLYFKITNNTLSGTNTMINVVTGDGAPYLEGRITGNTITAAATGAGFGINTIVEGNGQMRVVIQGNTINDFGDTGIRTIARYGSGRLDAQVTGNSVRSSNGSALVAPWYGFEMRSLAVAAGPFPTLCVDVSGNSTTNATGSNVLVDYSLRRNLTSTLLIKGLTPATADNTQANTYVRGQNPGFSMGTHLVTGDGFQTTASCNAVLVAQVEGADMIASAAPGAVKVLARLMPDRYFSSQAAARFTPDSGELIQLVIGRLPAGKKVTLRFDARINPSLAASTLQVSNQAQVTADSLSPVPSDDPDTAAAADATMTLVYRPPVAPNDGYSTLEDSPLTVPAPGVLGNDAPASGYGLTAVNFSTPTGGSVTGNPDGSFTYIPAANANGLFSFTYQANDGKSLSAPTTVLVTVTPVNDAPLLDPSGDLALEPIIINAFDNPGTPLSQILASGGGTPISDIDASAQQGIAVTAVDNTHGAWQYSLDDGSSWNDFAPLSESTARLLAVNAAARIRFVPQADWSGTVDPGITFRAWDQTNGVPGGTANAGAIGGITAFSLGLESASLTIMDQADLALVKAVTPEIVLAGQLVTYTLTAANNGPAPASGVAITDPLPFGTSFVSGSPGCTASGAVVVCEVGDLAAGAQAIRQIQVAVSSSAAGLLVNRAAVSSDLTDLVLDNNTDSAALTVKNYAAFYQQDFSGPVGSEWSSGSLETPACGSQFLGLFGNDTVSLSLKDLPLHTRVMLVFDLNIIGSWNGLNKTGGEEVGPDIWRLDVDGSNLINTTFSNVMMTGFRQSFPGTYPGDSHAAQTGAWRVNALCYKFSSQPMDATYRLTRVIQHTGSTLDLDFSALGLQGLENESWGLDNIQVLLSAGGPFASYQLFLPVTRR